jgi:hypothetical protein
METNFSVGTYSIDGISISYNAPSVLPKEVMDKLVFDNSIQGEIDQQANPSISLDELLKGTHQVPTDRR